MSGREQSYPFRVGYLEGLIDLFLRGMIDRDQLERHYGAYRADHDDRLTCSPDLEPVTPPDLAATTTPSAERRPA